jgi:uncharacterized protein YcbK (DUF882 family)
MKLSAFFDRSEFECSCGCGLATVDVELLRILDGVRINFSSPVTITSGHRCKTHNKAVGGVSGSYHVQGRAADIKVADVPPKAVFDYLSEVYKDSFGFICYDTFVHVDTRETPYRKSV